MEIVEQLVALREKHPYWGARKLLELSRRGDAQTAWPAASTVTDILKRADPVHSPRRRRIMPERSQPVREAVDHAMRSDNGTPFASIGAGGLSKLSLHWAKLGIRLEQITPGQPQQNGRHERMHATLKAQTTRPARFDRFRDEFNHDRPHEALGRQIPAMRSAHPTP